MIEMKGTFEEHKKGEYLEKPDEQEVKRREVEKKNRRKELEKEEEILKRNFIK